MKKIREIGRTALETLQVLAITGILTISFFFAYKYVMNRWRTNELLYEGSKRAVGISMRLTDGKQPDLRGGMYNDQTAGGRFDRSVILDADNCQFCLRVYDVPQIVCQNAILMVGEKTHLRRIAPENDFNATAECAPEKGNYVLVYSNDLSTTSDGCTTLNIVSSCTSDQFKDANGLCTSCSDTNSYAATEEECSKCSGRSMKDGQCIKISCNSGELLTSDGTCVPCGTSGALQASAAECSRCPDRKVNNDGECVVKQCGPGFFKPKTGQCVSCDDIYVKEPLDAGECNSCGALRRMEGGFCYLNCQDGWFQNTNGNCTYCGDLNAKETTQDQCDLCKDTPFGRTFAYNSKTKKYECSLDEPSCPDGYFPSAEDSRCKSCETEADALLVKRESDCTKCNTAGQTQLRVYVPSDQRCYLNTDTCPPGTYRIDEGTCKSCTNEKDAYTTSPERCAACNGKRTMGGDRCVLTPPNPTKCGDGYFQNSNGNCTSCQMGGGGKVTSTEQCNKCEAPFTRQVVNGYCKLPKGCPTGYFQINDNSMCTSCDDPGSHATSSQNCSKCNCEGCTRRVFQNNRCVLATS